MCLTPIHLRTASIYRSLNGYSKFYVDVPCGQCAECQQQKKNDWYLRNYFESQSAWNSGGYILFDTLTYDDDHLPTVSKTLLGKDIGSFGHWSEGLECLDNFLKSNNLDMDFLKMMSIFRKCNYTCFDYHDIQNFLKLLRIRLERAGYVVENNLRYFIASEYGHDDKYVDNSGKVRKGTNRPHYHVLFYVNGSMNISPQVLSLFISTAWINGRTDGVPYKTTSYVVSHNTFGPQYIKDPNRLRGVQYYVSKYVCKDYEFHDSVDKRISYILTQLYHITYGSDEYKSRKRELHRFMDQFHRQSLSFGFEGLINSNVLNCIIKEGKIKLPDKEKVVKSFSVPMYYIRKLFQKCVKDSEGRQHWVWNDLGKEWKKSRISDSLNLFTAKMQDWYDNLESYSDPYCNFRSKVDKILDGRSFREYALYVIYYKGRFCKDRLNPDDIDVIVENSLQDPYSSGSQDYFELITKNLFRHDGDIYTDYDIVDKYVICDDCFGARFKGFDELFDMYHVIMLSYNLKKQDDYERKIATRKALKSIGFKCKEKF